MKNNTQDPIIQNTPTEESNQLGRLNWLKSFVKDYNVDALTLGITILSALVVSIYTLASASNSLANINIEIQKVNTTINESEENMYDGLTRLYDKVDDLEKQIGERNIEIEHRITVLENKK